MMSSPDIAPQSARAQDPWGGENMINGNDGMHPGLLSVRSGRCATGEWPPPFHAWARLSLVQRVGGPPLRATGRGPGTPGERCERQHHHARGSTDTQQWMHHHMRAADPANGCGCLPQPRGPSTPSTSPKATAWGWWASRTTQRVARTHYPTAFARRMPKVAPQASVELFDQMMG